jgi:hypothetical protein
MGPRGCERSPGLSGGAHGHQTAFQGVDGTAQQCGPGKFLGSIACPAGERSSRQEKMNRKTLTIDDWIRPISRHWSIKVTGDDRRGNEVIDLTVEEFLAFFVEFARDNGIPVQRMIHGKNSIQVVDFMLDQL